MNEELILELEKALAFFNTDKEVSPNTLDMISNTGKRLLDGLKNDDMNAVQLEARTISWQMSDTLSVLKKVEPIGHVLVKIRRLLKSRGYLVR